MTTFQAIDTRDNELKKWRGPNIEAVGFADAQFVINAQGKHFLKVEGIILKDTDGSNLEEMKLLN